MRIALNDLDFLFYVTFVYATLYTMIKASIISILTQHNMSTSCMLEDFLFHSILLQFTQLYERVLNNRQWWICVRAVFAH